MALPDHYIYPAIFYHDESGGYSVIFPDLKGFGGNTQGDTLEQAFHSAKEVLGLVFRWIEKEGDPIPKASDPEKIKKPENGFVSLIDVYMPKIRKPTKQYERDLERSITHHNERPPTECPKPVIRIKKADWGYCPFQNEPTKCKALQDIKEAVQRLKN